MPTFNTKPQTVRSTTEIEDVPPVVVGLGEGTHGISIPKSRTEALHVDLRNSKIASARSITAHSDETKHRLIQRTRRERMDFIDL